jgi:hypothetical protein
MTTAQNNIVAWWRMDDSLPSTVVLDSSGNGYNGASIRNTNLMHVAGKIDGALSFDGVNDYINTGQTFQAAFRNSFSINFWFNPNNYPPQDSPRWIIGNNQDVHGTMEIVYYKGDNGNNFIVYYKELSSVFLLSAIDSYIDSYEVLQWNMITITTEKLSPTTARMTLYSNSTLIATKDVSVVMSDFVTINNLFIGALNSKDGFDSTQCLDGSLDDVRIYNKALSADEVKQLYDEGNSDQNQLNATGERFLSEIGI